MQHLPFVHELLRLRRDLLTDEALHLALLDREVALVEHSFRRGRQVGELDRLHEVVHRALRQRLGGRGRVVHGREHHDREVGVDLQREGDELEARHARHAHVGEHQHELLAGEQVERGRAGFAGGHIVAARAEELAQRAADELLVVHHDDTPRRGSTLARIARVRREGWEGRRSVIGVWFCRGDEWVSGQRYALCTHRPASRHPVSTLAERCSAAGSRVDELDLHAAPHDAGRRAALEEEADRGKVKSIRYRGPIYKIMLALFVVSFVGLGYLGALLPSPVATFIAQTFSVIYFLFFLLMPWYTSIDKTKPEPERVTG